MPATNLFHALLETSKDHIYVIDRDLRYSHVSRGGAEVLGLTPAQMSGRSWRELGLPASTMEPVEHEWREILATGRTVQRETTYGTRHFEYVGFPVRSGREIVAAMVISREITARVVAEEEIRRSGERYRSLIANSSEGIWRFDLDEPIDTSLPVDAQVQLAFDRGYLAECNDTMAKMYGFERAEEIIGARLPDMLDPHVESNREFLRAFVRGGYRLADAESAEMDRRGQRRFLNSFTGVVENGLLLRSWGTQRDITDQKATIDRIRISEERLRALVSATEEVVWTTDPQGHVTSITPTWTTLTGQSVDDAKGDGWLAMIHPDDREAAKEQWTSALAATSVHEVVLRIHTTAGSYSHYRARSVPVLNEEGSIREWVGACTDVDSQHRHEEFLAAERARAEFIAAANDLFVQTLDYEQTLRNLVEMAVPRLGDWCAVDMIDADGSIRRLAAKHPDPEILKLAFDLQERYPADPSAPRGLNAVIKSGRTDWMREIPNELITASARSPEHLEMIRKLQLRSYIATPIKARARVTGVLTLVSSGRLYTEADVRLAEDLAVRAGWAIENATAYSEALTANRSKDEFVATMSHELRTPLTAILGWANLVRLAGYEVETMRRAIDMIETSAQTQAKLIDDLLDVSRIITGKFHLEMTEVDLVRVVEKIVTSSRPAAEARHLAIDLNAPPSLTICADANRMQQIVWNLMSNAVKFSADRGRVRVELKREGDMAVLRVHDEGSGIAPDLLPRVFDRFWQADSSMNRVQGGLGLGLAIVKHLTELHGGTVRAESEGIGRGSTFTVTVPVGEPASCPQPPAVSPADQKI